MIRPSPPLAILFSVGISMEAQSPLDAPQPHVSMGNVDAQKGIVPLRWTIRNTTQETVRLIRVDPDCPKTTADAAIGILPPGATTDITARFDPQNFGGPVRGELTVVPEHGNPLTLSFDANVAADILPLKPPARLEIPNIHPGQQATSPSSLHYTTRSGTPLDPDDVEISGSAAVGAHVDSSGGKLVITPFIEEPRLPLQMKGTFELRIHFKGCAGSLDHAVPLAWERADPLRIQELRPKTFEVSYEDDRVFSIRNLRFAKGLHYTATPLRGGRAVLLTQEPPKKPKPNPQAAPANPRPAAQKVIRRVPRRVIPKTPTPVQPKPSVFIQFETSHPYRPDVVIDRP